VNNQYLPDKAVITELKRETGDVRTYTLELAGGRPFPKFTPGQFNMLGYPGVGEAAISVSSLPAGSIFLHTIKAVGRVTDFLARFVPGDEIFWRGPFGRGWPLAAAEGKDLLLVAGGLGLAPLRPVLEAVMANREQYGAVTLVHGSRNPDCLLFVDQYEQWQKFFSVHLTVDEDSAATSCDYQVGLVTMPLDQLELVPAQTVAFVCGPEIMMRFVAGKLLARALAPTDIYVNLERRMKCGIGQCGHCQHGPAFVCKDGPVFSYPEASRFPDTQL
jgi:NAD(P)H-flavin reductase